MSVLLDTCALLALGNGKLPAQAAGALRRAGDAYVSSVSPWEIGIKVAHGKLHLRESPRDWFRIAVERHRLREVPVDSDLACAAAALPLIHQDPFDRVIVALAQTQALTVLTSDKNIAKYPGVKTLW
jgi:PIN domain nuclease of toxin-antitoxin system